MRHPDSTLLLSSRIIATVLAKQAEPSHSKIIRLCGPPSEIQAMAQPAANFSSPNKLKRNAPSKRHRDYIATVPSIHVLSSDAHRIRIQKESHTSATRFRQFASTLRDGYCTMQQHRLFRVALVPPSRPGRARQAASSPRLYSRRFQFHVALTISIHQLTDNSGEKEGFVVASRGKIQMCLAGGAHPLIQFRMV
jgi:hypothetical protein